MDTLSKVLSSVRLEGALYINAEFAAPWCIRGRFARQTVRKWIPTAEHVIYFHYIVEGACKVRRSDGGDVLDVSTGDLVLFPHNDLHLMGSDVRLVPVETEDLPLRNPLEDGELNVIKVGGDGAVTRFVCGWLGCSRAEVRPLIEALPRLLRIPIGASKGSSLVRELLSAGVRESFRAEPGSGTALAKLAELLFVDAMRRYVADLPPDRHGWFAALRDAHIGRALSLMHESPSRDWTVEELAREVALSRSALAERFTTLIGEPPMQYLKRWRLGIAARTLRAGNEHIGRIADRCGYESEAAFTRAFKREFGMPPREWRKSGSE